MSALRRKLIEIVDDMYMSLHNNVIVTDDNIFTHLPMMDNMFDIQTKLSPTLGKTCLTNINIFL